MTDPRHPGSDGVAPGATARKGRAAIFLDAVLEGNSAMVTFLAFVTAIVLGGLMIAFSDKHVLHAWSNFFSSPGGAIGAAWDSASSAYTAMFRGAVFNVHTISKATHGGSVSDIFNPISETIVNATPLILTGLAVMLPFRAGLFNIGATAQFIGGAFIAGWIGFGLHLPLVIGVVASVIGGFIGGAAVGWIVGYLRAATGASEVIVTIMLNYIAEYLLLYLLGTSTFQRKGRTDPISPVVHQSSRLPHLAGDNLRLNAGILLALAAAAGVGWLLTRSTLGFEIRAVGANPSAARAAGIKVERVYVLVFVLAGALAGLAGATVLLGTQYALDPQIYGAYGIEAITIALLGRGRPAGTVLASLLFGALEAGGVTMQAATQTPSDIVTVIQSVIVLFIAAPPLIRGLYRLRGARVATGPSLPTVATEV